MEIRHASNPFPTTMSAMPAYQPASIGVPQTPGSASTARVRQSKPRCRFSTHTDVHCYFADLKIRCLGSLHQLGFCVPPSHATFADNNGITLPTSPFLLSKAQRTIAAPPGYTCPSPPTTATSTPAPSPNAPSPPSPPSPSPPFKQHQQLRKHTTPPLSPRNH